MGKSNQGECRVLWAIFTHAYNDYLYYNTSRIGSMSLPLNALFSKEEEELLKNILDSMSKVDWS